MIRFLLLVSRSSQPMWGCPVSLSVHVFLMLGAWTHGHCHMCQLGPPIAENEWFIMNPPRIEGIERIECACIRSRRKGQLNILAASRATIFFVKSQDIFVKGHDIFNIFLRKKVTCNCPSIITMPCSGRLLRREQQPNLIPLTTRKLVAPSKLYRTLVKWVTRDRDCDKLWNMETSVVFFLGSFSTQGKDSFITNLPLTGNTLRKSQMKSFIRITRLISLVCPFWLIIEDF